MTLELTRENLPKVLTDIQDRLSTVEGRGDVLSPDEKTAMFTDLKRAQDELAALKPIVDGLNRVAPGSGAGDGSLAGMGRSLMRLDPPKGMDRLHFNMVALAPEEMGYAGSLRELPGFERIAKTSGLSAEWTARIHEFHALNDLLLLSDVLLEGHTEYASQGSRAARIKTLKLYRDYSALVKEIQRAAGTAMDTATAEQGLEWVPTMWSSQLIGLIQAELIVANLFGRITMPTPTYKLPILGYDKIAYLVPENVEETGGTAVPSNTFGTAVVTLTAKKLATRIMASTEILEDSIINMAPMLSAQIAKSIARATDDFLLNGDVGAATGTHQDNDIGAGNPTDRRRLAKGLRKLALQNSATVNLGGTDITNIGDLSVLTHLMAVKAKLGVYGSRPGQAAWICGFSSLLHMMAGKDGLGNNIFLTNDKFGPGYVAPTGQLGVVLGSPVFLSEFVRQDVDKTGFVNSATGANNKFTTITYVNRDAFTIGDRRALTIARSDQRYIEFDQTVLVGTWRGDFQPYYPNDKAVGIIGGIIS